jgi:hypothetical protein
MTNHEMKNARAGFRRAQFRLSIFSYTLLAGSSRKRVSRLLLRQMPAVGAGSRRTTRDTDGRMSVTGAGVIAIA